MSSERRVQNTNDTNLGVALGLLVCGLEFLILPKWFSPIGVVTWIFYAIGVLLLLFGTMGTCIEAVKLKQGRSARASLPE